MLKIFKPLLILTAIILILLIVAAYAAVQYVKSDSFKQDIVTQLKEETGRDLSIDGDLNLTVYPWAGVDINGIKLANAKGFGDELFLKADKLAVRIKTMPLLKKRYELDTLKLYGAEINLARNKEGVSNWDDLMGDQSEQKESGEIPELSAVILGGVDIKDAKLSWRDDSTGQNVSISNFNASTGELTFGDPIELVASLSAKSKQPDISGDVSLNGTLNYDLDKELYTLKPFTVKSMLKGKNIPGGETELNFNTALVVDMDKAIANLEQLNLSVLKTELNANLTATDVDSSEPSAKGQFQFQGDDLARLFKVLEIEPLASDLANQKDRSFSIQSSFDANLDDGTASLPDLTARLPGTELNVKVNASQLDEASPSAKGSLIAKGSDLPLLIKLLGQFQGGDDQSLAKLGKDLSKQGHKSFDVNTEFDLNLANGTINIPALSAQLIGADIKGQVSASGLNGDSARYQGQLKARGPDLPSLIRLAGNLQGDNASLAETGAKLSKVDQKDFDVDTVFDLDPAAGKMNISKLTAKVLGLDINGNLDSSKGGMKGNLKVKGSKLKGLLAAFDQADLGEVLKSIDIDAGVKGDSSDMQLSPLNLKATVSGKQIPNSPVDLVLTGDARANLDKQNFSIKNLSLKGLGLNLSGNLAATNIDKDANFDGDLEIARFNLRKFLQQLNQPLPDTANGNAFSKFSFSSKLKGNSSNLELSGLQMNLDESEIRGDLSVKNFDQPAIAFGIGINKINVDDYMPPDTNVKATPETAAAGAAQLPLETLRALDINGELLIGKLTYSNMNFNDVSMKLLAKDGKIKLDPATAQLYQGEYKGTVALDATGNIPKLTVNTNFINVETEPLLEDFLEGSAKQAEKTETGKPKSPLSGTGNINLALISAGSDVNTLKKHLSGTGSIKLQNGVFFAVFDVGYMLRQVEIMFEDKRPGELDKGEQTEFNKLRANLDIKKGVVNNDDMLLTAPGFKVTGNGMMANLNDETWKYNLKAAVDENNRKQW